MPESSRQKLSFLFLAEVEEITAVLTLHIRDQASPNFHTWYRGEKKFPLVLFPLFWAGGGGGVGVGWGGGCVELRLRHLA